MFRMKLPGVNLIPSWGGCEHVHQYGSKFEPQEIMLKATGSKITPEPYMAYLRKKYTEIYDL